MPTCTGRPSSATTSRGGLRDLAAGATSRSCRRASRSRRPHRPPRAGSAARTRGRRGRRRRSARRRRSTRLPCAAQEAPPSRRSSRRFSSGSTFVTFSRCSFQVLPTSVQTGREGLRQQAQRRVVVGRTSRRRVIPKAAISAVSKVSPASSSKSASSFGFEAGKPASMKWMPSASSACATRTFSPAESDMPSPCMPSRRVVS